ncbi:MAG: DinB family protein [Acidimicrobiales bacterium]
MVTGFEMSMPAVMVKTARAGFNINKASAKGGREFGDRPVEQLMAAIESPTELSGFAKVIGYSKLIPDVTIHHEDIWRAVGLAPHVVPVERMKYSLSTLRKDTGPLKAKKRSQGLRFVATDIDWAEGEGPEVRVPALSLLLAMGGRAAGLDECEGDGVAVLRAR